MKFTEKQIEELKQIKYVKNVTSKSIIFTLEAKKKALNMKHGKEKVKRKTRTNGL